MHSYRAGLSALLNFLFKLALGQGDRLDSVGIGTQSTVLRPLPSARALRGIVAVSAR